MRRAQDRKVGEPLAAAAAALTPGLFPTDSPEGVAQR